MKKLLAALLPLAMAAQAWASPVIVDKLTGYTSYSATESIDGGGETSTLINLSGDAHIDGIQWAGMFARSTNTATASDMQFVVRFYDDAGTGPNTLLSEQIISPDFVMDYVGIGGDESYQYGGVFSGGVNVDLKQGNVWVSVSAMLKNDQLWFGASFEPNTLDGVVGTGGALRLDKQSPWIPVNDEVGFYDGRGRAVAIEGVMVAVPEPATYALMGLGLVLTGFATRRKSSNAC